MMKLRFIYLILFFIFILLIAFTNTAPVYFDGNNLLTYFDTAHVVNIYPWLAQS